MNGTRFWILTALVLLAAASRLAPHPDNVTPMFALALFGAATYGGRLVSVLVPLAALLLSDVLLHLTYLAGWQPRVGFYPGQWVAYACLAATILLGFVLRRRRTVVAIASATLASSLIFFLATNFVWFYGAGSLYPRTVPGLLACYRAALPFFRYSLAGDAFYSAALFGTFALAEWRFPALRRPAAPRGQAVSVAG